MNIIAGNRGLLACAGNPQPTGYFSLMVIVLAAAAGLFFGEASEILLLLVFLLLFAGVAGFGGHSFVIDKE